jgi:RNA-binding protein YlmH
LPLGDDLIVLEGSERVTNGLAADLKEIAEGEFTWEVVLPPLRLDALSQNVLNLSRQC